MVLGLVMVIYLSQKSLVKSIVMALFGLILSYVGLDIVTGRGRFTLNIDELLDGLELAPMMMGLFAISEVCENLEVTAKRSLFKAHIKGLLPTLKDWADSITAILRGTVIGFVLGILPGGNALIASFVSYAVEKKVSKHPENFGKGAIEAVAGPESANNAASSAAFLPLLTLGIPSNVVMAMLFAGFMIHNIVPGPLLLQQHPDLFWGVVTSMYIGNVMLLVLNLPLIGIWVQITKVPFIILYPLIVLFCLIGVYSINNSVFDIWVMVIFGILGYTFRKCKYEPAPFALAFVLGPILEQAMRQSLLMSDGSFSIFVFRPISVVCLGIAAFLLISGGLSSRKKRILAADESS